MTIHTKTAFILLTTLIVGMLLGALVSGPLLMRRLPPHAERFLAERFVARHEELIDPDESQRDTVRAILENYADRFVEMNRRHLSEMTTLMDSLNTDLSSLLTKEQIEKLERSMERRRRLREGPPFRRGRPGP